MKLKTLFIKDCDIVNYKTGCLYMGVGYTCSRGCKGCQNDSLKGEKALEVDPDKVVQDYLDMPVTHAIVFAGLEPLEDLENLILWCRAFRDKTDDPIIIYTGAEVDSDELLNAANWLRNFKNIIFKAGMYLDDQESHYDELLGVNLASNNQMGIRLEEILCA